MTPPPAHPPDRPSAGSANLAPLRPCVVLLSGGLDSATTLAVARAEGFAPYALSFRYGQRHAGELDAARRVAQQLGAVRHEILDLDLTRFGGSALIADLPVPTGRSEAEMAGGIPVTYVPARNTIFLSFALGFTEALGAADIFIGVNAVDYSGYPDCRPEFIRAFEALAALATKAGVEGRTRFRVHTPLIELSKAEIIRRGIALGVDFALTRSCYQLDVAGRSCGGCDACLIRLRGFRETGIPDPAPYVTGR
jgi:7-cyano-7-deazaguanine synthase